MRSQPLSLYLLNFFISLHLYSVAYIASGFITERFGSLWVSPLFALQALIGVLVLACFPALMRIFGSARVFLWLLVMEGVVFWVIAKGAVSLFILPAILFSLMSAGFFSYCLDIFMEREISNEEQTGGARTAQLTVANAALILPAFVAGFIAEVLGFRAVYAIATLFLIPALYVFLRHIAHKPEPHYTDWSIHMAFDRLYVSRDVRTISVLRFLLNIFFTWMVIYLPLFLYQEIGFSWLDIGTLLSIILIPYILTELPAGLLADRYIGEQELLIGGFLLMAAGTVALSFTNVASFWFFAVALITTRFGGALVESMTETYFFRRVGAQDEGIIMFFRLLYPASYLIGAILGASMLFFLPLSGIWAPFGVILSLGALFTLGLRDTK